MPDRDSTPPEEKPVQSGGRNAAAVPMDALWDEGAPGQPGVSEPTLVVDIDGFEGPLDLLLHLARHQRVDLARISVLDLAEQYLRFIDSAARLRLELAADYLVMAAWLAYLKSRLLLPRPKSEDEASGEELAAQLAFRLKRLEAMRDAGSALVNRNRLGRDVFARGAPEPVIVETTPRYEASLYDLLTAYAAQRQRQSVTQVTIAKRQVWSLGDARSILMRLVGDTGIAGDWVALDGFLLRYIASPEDRPTAIASAFAASLELVREGQLEIRQERAFAPIYMRRATEPRAAAAIGNGQSG